MCVLLIFLVLFFIYSLYILYRNCKVYKFSIELIDILGDAARKRIGAGRDDWEDVLDLIEKHSYETMLFSFKPLKLENWYTEDEIKQMKGEDL